MAIIPLRKATLYGAAHQKDAVLDGLQALGCFHLVDLGSAPPAKSDTTTYIATDARAALKYLQTCPIQRRPEKDAAHFDQLSVQVEALKLQEAERALRDEADQLGQAIADLEPWGNFRLPAPSELGKLRFWFYTVPHYRVRTLAATDLCWYVAGKDSRFTYVVVVSETAPATMPGTRVELDERPLSDLKRRLDRVESELEDLHWHRVGLTRWRSLFEHTLNEADDRAARDHAAQKTLEDGSVFALAGWTPRESLPAVHDFATRQALALTVEAPGPAENPPTLLRNPERFAGGEDAVKFYMTPAYRTWDPSLIVFVSFAAFFGMILADAGYGLLLGTVLLLFWRRLGRSDLGGRVRNLALALVAASVAYGVLIGSYFGLAPSKESVLGALHLLDSQDQGLMMRLAIGVGVLHLVLAHLVTAWGERRSFRVLAALGWSAMLLGGYALGLGAAAAEPPTALIRTGGGALAGGAGAVLLFSSRRPLSWKAGDLAGRLLDGVKSLAGVSQAFGDALSYLRLFALGLASAQLAKTFNDLAYSASCCIGIGALLAVLVTVLGHGLNFALGIMSGVVHGLRLNCIEFFNWSLPEEGYPFRAFCKKANP